MKTIKNTLGSVVIAASVMALTAPVSNAIINPIYVEPGDKVAESVALLKIPNEKENYATFCTGALVDPEWVITAAHCFGLNDEYVPGGEYTPPTTNDSLETENSYESLTQNISDDSSIILDSSVFANLSSGSSFSGGETLPIPDNEEEDNKRVPQITFGPEKNTGQTYNATHVYAHPNGLGELDMALVKLDRPANDVPVLKMNTESLDDVIGMETRTYGWSHLSNDSTTLRYMEGRSYIFNGEVMTNPHNESRTENGDSGGPVVNSEGELISVHYARGKETGTAFSNTTVGVQDWINTILNTK